jgi:ribose transport system substrate-binding protein
MKKGRVCVLMAVFLVGLMTVPQSALAGRKKILAHSMSTVTHFWFATQRDEVKAVCEKRGVTHWFVDGQDRADKQIADLEDLAVKKPDVVLINTMYANSITPGVEALKKAGIPVVVLSSPLAAGALMDCWVSADQFTITAAQAELTAKALNYQGNWIQIEGKPGSLINKARGDGWHSVFKKYPKLKRTGHFHGNYVRHEALRIMEDVLQSHKEPIAMVYGHNDEMALGVIQAIKEAGRPIFPKDGKGIMVVGVDALMQETYDAIKNGEMHNSSRWPTFGKEAATIACDYLLKDKPLPKKWFAPPYVVTKETLKDW